MNFHSQLCNVDCAPTKRQWTGKDENSVLTVYKRSPCLYRYIYNCFQLRFIASLKNISFSRDVMKPNYEG